ncbi:MAG: biotin/lipoyl-containing protein [Bacillota bacterium]|nr:biotin/lipoyl-containing protein [Bacillota bacterium]
MKKYIVNVNGTKYEIELEAADGVEVKSSADTAKAAPAATPAPSTATAGEKVNSPMPGTIIDIKVSTGDMVKEGQALVVLEAMKMENEIMAPCDGKVTVAVTKGTTVESGTLLCAIE